MRKTLALIVIVAAIAAVAGTAAPAVASEESAATLVHLINAERARAGRPALTVHPELAAYALRHSRDMAASDSIWHTPHVSRAVSVGTVVGENVGYAGSVSSIHAMFMDSPAHRANVLDRDYSMVGVGIVPKDGWIYVTEIFAGTPGTVARPHVAAAAPAHTASTDGAERLAGAANQTSILRQLHALDTSIGDAVSFRLPARTGIATPGDGNT